MEEAKPSSSTFTSCSSPRSGTELVEECITWSNLLPEVLELVFQELVCCKDDTSILTCRLINCHWKSVAESVMEQAVLSNFKNFSSTFRLIPRLSIVPSGGDDDRVLEKVRRYKFLQEENPKPFPSRSLLISPLNHDERHTGIKKRRSVSVIKLMTNFGHHLSSLTLDGVTLTSPNVLKVLLGEMKNLKALSLSRINLMTEDKHFREEKLTLAPPHLKILRLFSNIIVSTNQGFRRGTFNKWLATCFGSTLTHLEIDDAENLSFTPDNFPNLQVLTMYDVGTATLRNSEGLPRLQRMSIVHLSDEPGSKTCFKDLTRFLERFASTLIHLNLKFRMDEVKSEVVDFARIATPSFLNLKSFSYLFPSEDEKTELEEKGEQESDSKNFGRGRLLEQLSKIAKYSCVCQ
ncbi:hypothetical protein Ocin01_16691 [Orchesella cincta]|uniref:F-box domain-containing protein n=1 Tax=Orchesella cincta TaxID=48709 RepID=A0A1D2MAI9_ORCCI|nr:hypothetical protein Ocin01_16691 [Orchesella cincta]